MGRHYGKQVRLTTDAFAGILSGADDDVQKALETVDDHAHEGVYMPLAGGTFTGDVLFENGEQCRFRQATEYFASDNAGYLDAHAANAFRLTTTGVVSLTSPGNGVLQVAGDLWAIDSGGNPRLVLGDATTGGNWGSIRWVSASDSIGIGTDTGGVDTLLISEAGNVLLAGTGQFQFGDAGQYIQESAPTVLSYVSAGRHEFTGGPVYVGTGTPGHTITGSGDLYVADRLEVDGAAYFDNQTYFYGLMDCRDQHIMSFYGSTFGGLYRVGGDGLHFYVYGGAGTVQNRNLIICDYDARADDYDHSAISVNPTLFIQSDTRAGVATDEWWSITHDQTDALYNVGTGTHKFGQTVDVTGDIAVSGTVDGVDVAVLKTDFDAHDHDAVYYTETELDAGQLDNRYYTEGEVDTLLAAQDALSEMADVNVPAPNDLDNLSWDTGTSRWIPRAPGAPGAHDLGGASHNADTLANLNGKISDATLLAKGAVGHIAIGQTISQNSAIAGPPDYIFVSKWMARGNIISHLGVAISSFTAGNKIMMAIYSDNAGYPDAKLGETAEHTLVTAELDGEILLALASPVALTPGTQYWIAWNVDTNTYYIWDAETTARTTQGLSKPLTYDGTMPATFPAAGSADRRKCVFGVG